MDYKLIAGLGNPGPEYEATRHNAGFLALDLLADELGARYWKNESGALVAHVQHGGEELLLVKPQAYMNTSGGPISKLAAAHKVAPEEILVIHDEMDLEPGTVRVKVGGGHGGHNGLKSIISCLGSDQFPRVKIGVGAKPHPDYDLADWVLSTVSKTEWPDYQDAMEHAAEAALCIVKNGCEKAAAEYNGKRF